MRCIPHRAWTEGIAAVHSSTPIHRSVVARDGSRRFAEPYDTVVGMIHPADWCGVYSLAELRQREERGRPVGEIIAELRLIRLRRGWFASAIADARVVEAVRAGGVVSCVTALDMFGIWVPPHPRRLHIRACTSTMRSAKPGKFCCAVGGPTRENRAVDDLETALLHAVKCLDDEGVVAILDSVLNQRLLTEYDLESLFSESKRVLRLLAKCDGRAQSGLETFARLRLKSKRVRVEPQVYLACVGGWVDLLVGNRLILELDGQGHNNKVQFERDRERDLGATEAGYDVVRLSYSQVVDTWEQSEAAIMAKIRRREHLRKLPADTSLQLRRTSRQ